MKYEAKCAATSDLTTGLTSPATANETYADNTTACTSANSKAVVSLPSGYPIANISQTNSITRCSTVSLGSTSAHLITNDEWMTIARNAEAQASNWTLGSVGSGYLFAGHNDNGPALARRASTTDTGNNRCAYTDGSPGTEAPSSCPTNTANGQAGTGANQVRVLTLSNNAPIWDFAGNVWEWTNNTITDQANQPDSGTHVGSFNWTAFTALTGYGTLSYDAIRPLNTSYNNNYGMGSIYHCDTCSSNATTYGFFRGGSWGSGADTGAFTLVLDRAPSFTSVTVGFRCASDPVAISQSWQSNSGRQASGGNSVTIGSVSDGKIYQSVNVGDTSTYNLSAYVYNNTAGSEGGTVSSSIASLYYNGAAISTTYTDAGSGWWKLTGTLTGANASREYGVLVKTGKTVKTDDFSLSKEYNSSGTLTSSIFDTEFAAGAAYGTLTYSSSGSTVAVKARTSNSSSMSGATAFSSCNAITTGSDISSNNCVTDSHRYIQYQLSLSTSDTALTPTISDISIAFETFDTDAPSVSLTALSPDPNSDTTPTLSGTATESTGTVSNVQFQMDSTSGSWTACTATDGNFNSSSETFNCTSSALSDGSHTMYVRATDSNGNTTSSSYASDTFTIDATVPTSIDLDSPGDNSYTSSERPTFKWKATTDATAGLSKYVLEVDNPSIGSSEPGGDFTIDNIPTSRTTDYETNKYVVHYENFSDSDSTNNYISVYTKSDNEWAVGENYGKTREGKVSWRVKAVDSAGNETSSSRTLFVDRTKPNTYDLKINGTTSGSGSFNTTDTTPTISGKIIDTLSGGDTSKVQDEYGPRVAGGPGKVDIKVEKKLTLGHKLISLYTINFDKPKYTCGDTELSDNTKQKCDKYSLFEYALKENLEFGTYKVTVTGKDKADNESETVITLNVSTLDQITTPEERQAIEEEINRLPVEEQQKARDELEITKPTEPKELSIIEKTGKTVGNFVTGVFSGIGNGLRATGNAIGSGIAFVGEKIGDGFTAFGNGYNQLAENSPGVIKTVLLSVENGFSGIGNFAREGTATVALAIGEKAQGVSEGVAGTFIKIGYSLLTEPTKITSVEALVLSPTEVKVTWVTNHPANGKVNWGFEDGVYEFEAQEDKRTTKHEFTLTGLKPDTQYHYEVMSQNKNYVYDANRKFSTPAE